MLPRRSCRQSSSVEPGLLGDWKSTEKPASLDSSKQGVSVVVQFPVNDTAASMSPPKLFVKGCYRRRLDGSSFGIDSAWDDLLALPLVD